MWGFVLKSVGLRGHKNVGKVWKYPIYAPTSPPTYAKIATFSVACSTFCPKKAESGNFIHTFSYFPHIDRQINRGPAFVWIFFFGSPAFIRQNFKPKSSPLYLLESFISIPNSNESWVILGMRRCIKLGNLTLSLGFERSLVQHNLRHFHVRTLIDSIFLPLVYTSRAGR